MACTAPAHRGQATVGQPHPRCLAGIPGDLVERAFCNLRQRLQAVAAAFFAGIAAWLGLRWEAYCQHAA